VTPAETERARLTRSAALASASVAVTLLGLKTWAAWATGSVAMLGSLADTTLDLLASLVTLFAVGLAATPADDDHRFGHGKAEAIAALMQTLLIIGSAVAIFWRAISSFGSTDLPRAPEVGIGVSAVGIVLTLALVAWQKSVVRRTGSVAISTDSLHYQSDLLLNSAVIIAFVLDVLLGLHGADAVLGIVDQPLRITRKKARHEWWGPGARAEGARRPTRTTHAGHAARYAPSAYLWLARHAQRGGGKGGA
jgi:ferrous-iron efflux pump FieF